jgi:hypothetical protein
MLGQSRKDKAAEAAKRHEAFQNSFAGQVKKIQDCKDHTYVADPHYDNKEFCSTCETEK